MWCVRHARYFTWEQICSTKCACWCPCCVCMDLVSFFSSCFRIGDFFPFFFWMVFFPPFYQQWYHSFGERQSLCSDSPWWNEYPSGNYYGFYDACFSVLLVFPHFLMNRLSVHALDKWRLVMPLKSDVGECNVFFLSPIFEEFCT